MSIEKRAADLFLQFTEPGTPAPGTCHASLVGKQVVIGSALPIAEGRLLHRGVIGADLSVEQARAATRQAVVCALGMTREALGGSLDSVKRILQLSVYLIATPDFKDHDKVADAGSQLLHHLFNSPHTRTVIGVASLPKGSPVAVSLQLSL